MSIRRSDWKYILLMFLVFKILTSCQAQAPSEKINGISLVASRDKITSQDITPILNVNANTVAVMPFAFLEGLSSPDLKFNLELQWYGERREGAREAIQLLQNSGLKVMLKPQIWIRRGEFTGAINMSSEKDWVLFEQYYRDFIMLFASLAQEQQIDYFSIGTELHGFVKTRPEFWIALIAEIRTIYKGNLTYAENWDKIEEVPFWKSLDFIGVDAYFPLNEGKSPSLSELRTAWAPHKSVLKNLSKTVDKPILFTEYGYRNIDFATKAPWDSSRDIAGNNNELQADALEALYAEFWFEPWFAGGFLWKWHHDHELAGGLENNQFTPQNKPAESVVKLFYGGLLRN
ncbi:glycoside hydrolase family 113 [Gillisia limnaea]|uniref:Glycoside hydrolase n=1 Tax=Gillisia limnaea (strain DSM 15749 / LMG 21470 / R-8282) TaxID=865937 RepID=H2C033_GILLR|nr:hypothetical protein [Gillisia limnaea]EHQ02400.1 hypothetical protein Gilli_1757 [Gillisia limnaea DSM 15749]